MELAMLSFLSALMIGLTAMIGWVSQPPRRAYDHSDVPLQINENDLADIQ
jgi:hypothetical protein